MKCQNFKRNENWEDNENRVSVHLLFFLNFKKILKTIDWEVPFLQIFFAREYGYLLPKWVKFEVVLYFTNLTVDHTRHTLQKRTKKKIFIKLLHFFPCSESKVKQLFESNGKKLNNTFIK